MPPENPRITVPDMCQKHQRLLLDQIGIGPEGPWRAHIIVAQIALFQGTTAHAGTYERIGGDVTRIGELGCLACYRPDTFGAIVQAFQQGGIAAVKQLGERLVEEAGQGLRLPRAESGGGNDAA
jgi:hypothetical protein